MKKLSWSFRVPDAALGIWFLVLWLLLPGTHRQQAGAQGVLPNRRANFQPAAATAPTPDWLWLKLNDGSGATAVDSSANGDNVALTASPIWGTGSLIFDGTSQSGMGAATGVNFQDNNSWSIAVWIKTTQTTSGAIFSTWEYNSVGGSGVRLCISDAGSGIISLLIADSLVDLSHGNYRLVHGSAVCNDNALHLIVATYDGSGSASHIKLYVDGSLDTSAVDSDTAPPALANNHVYLARIGNATTSQFYAGTENEVAVYGKTLSQSEITALNTLGPR